LKRSPTQVPPHPDALERRTSHVRCTRDSGVRLPRWTCAWLRWLRTPWRRTPHPGKPQWPARGPGVATRCGTPAPWYPARMQAVQLASRTSGLPPSPHTVSSFPSPLIREPSQARAEQASAPSLAKDSVAAELVVSLLTDKHQSPTHVLNPPSKILVHRIPPPNSVAAGSSNRGGLSATLPLAAPAGHVSPPSKPQNEIVVSPLSLPTTSPAHTGLLLAKFWSSTPAMAPWGHIASSSIIPGSFP
jgi:hypothetical protein